MYDKMNGRGTWIRKENNPIPGSVILHGWMTYVHDKG